MLMQKDFSVRNSIFWTTKINHKRFVTGVDTFVWFHLNLQYSQWKLLIWRDLVLIGVFVSWAKSSLEISKKNWYQPFQKWLALKNFKPRFKNKEM